ncbi:MAG: Wadjet anti-phage system protein JetA family protein [Eubacteriales bacterium]|jgi:hypothetical protein
MAGNITETDNQRDIFDYVENDSFFAPLVGRNRRIYYEIMTGIIRMKKERPVLYETDLRDYVDQYLKNRGIDFLAEDSGDEEKSVSRTNSGGGTNSGRVTGSGDRSKTGGSAKTGGEAKQPPAGYIISRLHDCGWLTDREKKGLAYTVSVTAPAMRIMGTFMRICEQQNSQRMSNRFLSMSRLMTTAMKPGSVEATQPYSLIVQPLFESVNELELELSELRDNVSTIMRTLMKVDSMNGLGNFLSKDRLQKKFFRDYFFLKNSGLIPARIASVEQGIRKFRHNKELYGKAAAELSEKDEILLTDARIRIDTELTRVSDFLAVQYNEMIHDVEMRINKYYNLAHTRLMVMMSSGKNTRAQVDDLLHAIGKSDEETEDRVVSALSECIRIYNMQYISVRSFHVNRRNAKAGKTRAAEVPQMTEEEKRRRTQELLDRNSDRFTPERVDEYFSALPFHNGVFETGDAPVRSREDALMYAAAVGYARSEDFPYEVEMDRDIVHTEAADISRIRLKKKAAKAADIRKNPHEQEGRGKNE